MTLGNLGDLHDAVGNHEVSAAMYRRALDILEEVHGPDHPAALEAARSLEVAEAKAELKAAAPAEASEKTDEDDEGAHD
jgi:hypothetical protein